MCLVNSVEEEMIMGFWTCLAVAFGMVQISMLFSTIFLHRHAAHESVTLRSWVRFVMHLWIAVFTGINVQHWIAAHRKHHATVDTAADPFSPRFKGFWTVLLGTAFIYHNTGNAREVIERYVPRYQPDLVDRFFWPLGHRGLGGLAILLSLDRMIYGDWRTGLIIWTMHMFLYIFFQSLLNSAGHMYGRHSSVENLATNSLLLALLTAGEGWHHNHHERPASSCFSRESRQPDFGWWAIKLLMLIWSAYPIRISRSTDK